MKKLLAAIAVLAVVSSVVYGGDNQSAKYVRSLSRNSATDSIDTVYFNPAGTAYLQRGFHIQLNGQAVRLNYSHEVQSETYKMINWVPFVPSAYAGYSGGNWAIFAGYSIPQGGGSLKWDSAKYYVPNIPPQFAQFITNPVDINKFEGASSTHMLSVGVSHTFTPVIAAGARFDMSFATAKYEIAAPLTLGGNSVNYIAEWARSGRGFGGALGIHLRPHKAINASLTVESIQKIKLKVDSSSENPNTVSTVSVLKKLTDNTPDNADTPWAVRAGFSFASPNWEIPVSLKYSFWKAIDSDKKDEVVLAVGFRYWLTEQLELSVGSSYANSDTPEDKLDTTFLDPELASITIGGGLGWEVFDNFNLDLGLLCPIYFKNDGQLYKKLSKQVVDISLGIGYVF